MIPLVFLILLVFSNAEFLSTVTFTEQQPLGQIPDSEGAILPNNIDFIIDFPSDQKSGFLFYLSNSADLTNVQLNDPTNSGTVITTDSTTDPERQQFWLTSTSLGDDTLVFIYKDVTGATATQGIVTVNITVSECMT